MLKPMLAAGDKDILKVLKSLRYPLLASPKLDGIRGFNHEGSVYSRNLKEIPNEHIRRTYGWDKYDQYDGEFIAVSPTDPLVFSKTSSIVMSRDKPIESIVYWAFDWRGDPSMPYYRRLERLAADNLVLVVPQHEVSCEDELLDLEGTMIDLGYEGLIMRDPEGRYKDGRSTLNEGLLVKFKRFVDDEAVVIGFEERMHNANEKTLVKNGKATRSSHAAGLRGLDTLGAVVVRWRNHEFRIGSGFDAALAQEVWNNREKYLGAYAKFKYFPVGVKDLPRHPVFLGFRHPGDM